MDFKESFKFWKENSFFDTDIKNELNTLDEEKDIKEIEDRFYRELDFGTAGLRGVMAAGTNRMNKYIIGKASAGFAKYLIHTYGETRCKNEGVVIGYDTRNNSTLFASVTANVLSGFGIKVLFLEYASPIPILSFAIRKYNAVGGVMITASHNPKEYNGYKVYDSSGCQLGVSDSNMVTNFIKEINSFEEIDFVGDENLISKIDVLDEYIEVISQQSLVNDQKLKDDLKIVYTPLHGTGLVPVTKTLEKNGFKNVYIVEEQKYPDGNFSTVKSPNPGDKNALVLGIEKAKNLDADIVLGTDPDSDRVGVAVKNGDDYKLLTGNQIGALLIDFILSNKDLSKINKPAMIKSIVTSNLGFDIAKKKGIHTFETLTGFKFIGERMNEFELARDQEGNNKDFDFLFGYEESYGYLSGTHVRDKDAVVSSFMICEMSAKLKGEGKTLIDRLNEIYAEFGYYYDTQESLVLKGKENLEKITAMMDLLRNSCSPFFETKKVLDYSKPVPAEEDFGYLPVANVLYYEFFDGSWIAVRPSGTEPQIKFYYSIKGNSEEEAMTRQQNLKENLMKMLSVIEKQG